ncbi:MAG: gamma-glutamyl-gamma-aminobutyrate hydrolase family protein [Anaerolineae bacterium]
MPDSHPVIGIPTGSDPSTQYYRTYAHAVWEAGGIPLLILPGLDGGALEALIARLDGLLLAGGGDVDPALYGQAPHPNLTGVDRARDDLELPLARLALHRGLPVLGICRGIQVLNVATGGTLYQDLPSQRTGSLAHGCFQPQFPPDHLAHEVALVPGSLLARTMGQEAFPVNSRHHQGIDRLGERWRAVAYAPDGLVEAIEAPDHPFALGVQWHPENLLGLPEHGLRLFAAFVSACGAR